MRCKLLLLMLTAHEILCDVGDIVEERLLKKEESPSSGSKTWQDEESEILVFEDDQSLLNEKNKFKRSSRKEEHVPLRDPQVAALHRLPPSNIPQWGLNPSPGPHQTYAPSCWMCSLERNGCQIVSGIFTRSTLPYGYSLVTALPAGVCNITVVEVKPSKNYFALRRKDNNYVLNGNWDLQAAGSYRLAGTIFHYSPSDGTRGEMLEALGPLLEPLDLMIIYQSKNPGIKYEYRIPVSDLKKQQLLRHAGGVPKTYPLNGPHQNYPPGFQQPRIPSNHPQISQRRPRPPFGLPVNLRPTFHKSFEGSVPPNWNSLLAIGSSGPSSSAQGINPSRRGKSNIPNLSHVQRYHQSLPTSEPNSYNGLAKDPLFGILNTESRSSIQDDASNGIQRISSSSNRNSVEQSNNRGTLKYFPQPNIIDQSSNNHRARHNHGPTETDPLVGRKGTSQKSKEKHSRFLGPKSKNNNKGNSRKRKKKGKRKNGRRRKNRYIWTFKGLSGCSRSCGGGEQRSMYSCERRRKGIIVADKFCQDVPRSEIKVLTCNLNPCPAKWVATEWSPCSVTCGKGVQIRKLQCKQEVSPTLTMMVPQGACFSPKTLDTSQECYEEDCPSWEPHWKTGKWSDCSTECGEGIRTREIRCHHLGSLVADSICGAKEAQKPVGVETCDGRNCIEENTWFFSSWSQNCTEDCENGINSRTVVCIQSELDFDDTCPISKRPEPAKPCSKKPNCVGQWFTGPWSPCSVSCAVGFETRIVKCLILKEKDWVVSDQAFCPSATRPLDSRECFQIACGVRWFSSNWNECSTSCDMGSQWRDVKCLDSHLQHSNLCSNDTKLSNSQECNTDIKCAGSASGKQKQLQIESQNIASDKTSDKSTKAETNSNDVKNQELFESKSNDADDLELRNVDSTNGEDANAAEENHNNLPDDDSNQRKNELEIVKEQTGNEINAIPDKDAQGDQSVASPVSTSSRRRKSKKDSKKRKMVSGHSLDKGAHSCVDKIKNCLLVFRARLCRLKYYNKLCCATCKSQ